MDTTSELLPDLKLRLNLQHPDVEVCYAEGYECALAAAGEENNPYSLNSTNSNHWLDGWWDGFYAAAPVFDVGESLDSADENDIEAVNDPEYVDVVENWLIQALEITGVIAISAVVGFQLLDLVA